MIELDKIRHEIQIMLSDERFLHTLGVEEICNLIGEKYLVDTNRLRAAALLHDIGKSLSVEDQLRIGRHYHISFSKDDIKARGIIHAKIGSAIANKKFGIKDREILNAISNHATGKTGMTMFSKIIFAADFLDPNRGYDYKPYLNLVLDDFEKGILEIAKQKIFFVINKKEYLHPAAIAFYNYQTELFKGPI